MLFWSQFKKQFSGQSGQFICEVALELVFAAIKRSSSCIGPLEFRDLYSSCFKMSIQVSEVNITLDIAENT